MKTYKWKCQPDEDLEERGCPGECYAETLIDCQPEGCLYWYMTDLDEIIDWWKPYERGGE